MHRQFGMGMGMGMGSGLGSGFGQQGMQSVYGQPAMGMQNFYRQPYQQGFSGQIPWGPMASGAQQHLISNFNTFHNNAMSDWTQSRPDYYQYQIGYGQPQFQPHFQPQFQSQTPFGQFQTPYQTTYQTHFTSPWQSGGGQFGGGQFSGGQFGGGQFGGMMGFSPYSTPLASQASNTLQSNAGSYRGAVMNDWSLSRPENQDELATAAMYSQAYGQGTLGQGGIGQGSFGQTTGQTIGQGFGQSQGLGQSLGQGYGQGSSF